MQVASAIAFSPVADWKFPAEKTSNKIQHSTSFLYKEQGQIVIVKENGTLNQIFLGSLDITEIHYSSLIISQFPKVCTSSRNWEDLIPIPKVPRKNTDMADYNPAPLNVKFHDRYVYMQYHKQVHSTGHSKGHCPHYVPPITVND